MLPHHAHYQVYAFAPPAIGFKAKQGCEKRVEERQKLALTTMGFFPLHLHFVAPSHTALFFLPFFLAAQHC